ncbi:MAG TPA: hypothetical protein VEM36_06700 [Xanthobacteraceae bacterium]|nr:hypothetical protein [Xanthobacteraceae bacterium]
MKIRSAKVIVTCPGRNFVTLKIETDQGLTGVGDAPVPGDGRGGAGAAKFSAVILRLSQMPHSPASCPAKAGHPVNLAVKDSSESVEDTGSPAFAGDDD